MNEPNQQSLSGVHMFSVRSLTTFLTDPNVRWRQKNESWVVDSDTGLARYISSSDGVILCRFSVGDVVWVSLYTDGCCLVHNEKVSHHIVAETPQQLEKFLLDTLPFSSDMRSDAKLMKRLVGVVNRHAWVMFRHSAIAFDEDEVMGISCSAE